MGDTVLTTDNPIIMAGVEQLPPIVCQQNSVAKVLPTEQMLRDSNRNGFGEKIGTYTNRATTMEQMLCKFEPNSAEYIELTRRIRLCMHFQQNEIDRIKGVQSPPMPKEWYDYRTNLPAEGDSAQILERKAFNMRILANKKPKFMIYIYDDLMREYRSFTDTTNKICLTRFKKTVAELEQSAETDEEFDFLDKLDAHCPVETCDSLMNKICTAFEQEFDGIMSQKAKLDMFDAQFLVPDIKVSTARKKSIGAEYKQYFQRTQEFFASASRRSLDADEIQEHRIQMINGFKARCEEICPDEQELVAILVELLYNSNKSKQFVWDVAGEYIVNHLLEQNKYNITFPTRSEKGEVVYNHELYTMETINLKEMAYVN